MIKTAALTSMPGRVARRRHHLWCLALMPLLSGCLLGPDLSHCRIIGGTSTWEATGYYTVTVLIENGADISLDLEDITVEITTYDVNKHVINENYPNIMKGEIKRLDNYSFSFPIPDDNGTIRSSHVYLKDRRGQLISEWPIEERTLRPRGTPNGGRVYHPPMPGFLR